MKKLFVLLFFVHCVLQCTITDNPYLPYAQTWTSEFIYDQNGALKITSYELKKITQLVESSLLRAQTTLATQEKMWQAMQLFWQGWQNIIQTRLNPSKQAPYAIAEHDKEHVIQDFWQQAAVYETVCKEYCVVAEQVVHGNVLETSFARDAVAGMRMQARICMVDALTDVKQHLQALYSIALKTSEQDLDASIEQLLSEDKKGFNLAAFLVDYIPKLAMHQFINADTFYTQLSQESWSVLDKMQMVGNQAWHAIETARADFYAALLQALHNADESNRSQS